MPDQLTQLTFEHKLTTHIAQARIPRRRAAGQQARAALIAAIAADHKTALRQATAAHLKAAGADGQIIEGLRRQLECSEANLADERAALKDLGKDYATLGRIRDGLRADLAKAKADHSTDLAHSQQRFGDLRAETQHRGDAHGRVVAGVRADISVLEEQVASLEGELRQATAELSRLRSTWTPPQDAAPEGPAPAPVPPPAAPATPAKPRTRKPPAGAR